MCVFGCNWVNFATTELSDNIAVYYFSFMYRLLQQSRIRFDVFFVLFCLREDVVMK